MCENIFRHNYKGKYVIFDFKEFSILQKYYLNNTLSHKSFNKIMFITMITRKYTLSCSAGILTSVES